MGMMLRALILGNILAGFFAWAPMNAYAQSDTLASSTRLISLHNNAFENIGYADASSRMVSLHNNAFESIGYADASSRLVSIHNNAFENIAYSDASSRLVSLQNNSGEFIAYSDATSRLVSLHNNAFEGIAYSDATSRLLSILNAGPPPLDEGVCSGGPIVWTWDAWAGANAYRVGIASAPLASAIVDSFDLADTLSFTWFTGPVDGETYYARFAASVDGGANWFLPSSFSDGILYDITSPTVDTPVGDRPDFLTVRFSFTGTDAGTIDTVRAQIATDTLFASPVADATIAYGQTLSITGTPGVSYYGRAMTVDCSGNQSGWSAISAPVTVPYPADLVVDSLFAPIEGIVGQEFVAEWYVRNKSTQGTAAGPWVDHFFLSVDDTLGGGTDYFLGAPSFDDSLAPDSGYARTFEFTYPAVSGSLWPIVVTDGTDAVEELTGESNNALTSAAPVSVVPSLLADLVVVSIDTIANGVIAGQPLDITYTVKNIGDAPTEAFVWNDNLYMVFDTIILDLDAELNNPFNRVAIAPNPAYLQPDSSYKHTVSAMLPSDISGLRYIWVYVDVDPLGRHGFPQFTVPEQQELNNGRFSSPFQVVAGPQPDLVVTTVTMPGTVPSGEQMTVNWTVKNIGQVPTDNGIWATEVYLSENDSAFVTFGDSLFDEFLHTSANGGILAPGDSSILSSVMTWVPPAMSGPHYVKVKVDVGNVISELGGEGNNVGVSGTTVTIALTAAPDLMPSDITPPVSAIPGHEFDFSWTVDTSATPPYTDVIWHDAIYLSSDAQFDSSDVLLESYGQGSGEEVGGSPTIHPYTKNRTVRLPNETVPGNYQLLVIADHLNELYEQNETNNIDSSASMFPVVSSPTDLTVAAVAQKITVVLDTTIASAQFDVGWLVDNAGSGDTPVSSWSDRVYFSTDTLFNIGDQQLVAFARNSILKADSSYQATEMATAPLVGTGDYYLLYAIDSDSTVFEEGAGEDNNWDWSGLTISGQVADLVIDTLVAVDSAFSGDTIRVDWIGRNNGNHKTHRSSWVDEVYLSQGTTINSESVLLGGRTQTGMLDPGETYSIGGSFAIPIDISGDWYLVVAADDDNVVFESNETNNSAPGPGQIHVELTPAPNLVPISVAADSLVTSGQTIEVTWQVQNQGTGATSAPAWKDAVYFSRDQILDESDDLFLGEIGHDLTLLVDSLYAVTDTLDVPSGTSGPYFAIVHTDSRDDVFEEDAESDNDLSLATLIDVVLPAPVDLVVDSVYGSSGSVALGESPVFNWRIRNTGSTTVNGRWFDTIFLSSDSTWSIDDKVILTTSAFTGGPVAPGGTVSWNSTGRVSGINPGDYFVIGRTDVRNQIPEGLEDNNTGVSVGTISVTAATIALGDTVSGPLQTGDETYYQLNTPAGETIRIALDHQSNGHTEMYVKFGSVPTTSDFDYIFDLPGLPDQEIVIPTSLSGTYYIFLKATWGAGAPFTEYDLSAVSLPFGITSVFPDTVGAGVVTLRLVVAQWDSTSTLELWSSQFETSVAPLSVDIQSATAARVLFNLDGVPHGVYDVIASQNLQAPACTLLNALRVTTPDPVMLTSEIGGRATVRIGTAVSEEILVKNTGNTNVPVAMVTVAANYSPQASFNFGGISPPYVTSDSQYVLGSIIVTNLGPGETRILNTLFEVSAGYLGNSFPYSVRVEGFTRNVFVDSIIAPTSDIVRDIVLNTPESPSEFLALADDEVAWRSAFINEMLRQLNMDGTLTKSPGKIAEIQDWLNVAENVLCGIIGAGTGGLCGIATAATVPLQCVAVGIAVGACCSVPANCEAVVDDIIRPFIPDPDPRDVEFRDCVKWDCLFEVDRSDPDQVREAMLCAMECAVDILESVDPNEKVGTGGFGAEGWLGIDRDLLHQVLFENVPDATASAVRVTITDPIDASFKPGSFRVGDMRIGDLEIDVPDNQISYVTQLDLTAESGVLVDIAAGVDVGASPPEAYWIFQAIDPNTGLPPTDPFLGFLPPNDSLGSGEGMVSYTIGLVDSVTTGTVVGNPATIVFDVNEPIVTNDVMNTIDAVAPSSAVDSIYAGIDSLDLTISWTGTDDPEASGLAGYALYISDNSPFFTLSESALEDTFLAFTGEPGHTYGFFTIATDNTGNEQAMKFAADKSITMPGLITAWPGDTDNSGAVSQNDVLPIGLYFELAGSARAGGNLSWTPQTVVPWASAPAVFADVNGDGIVNQNDLLGVALNFGQVHAKRTETPSDARTSSLIFADHEVGERIPVAVEVDSAATWMPEILGVGGQIVYPQEYLRLDTVRVGQGLDDGDLIQLQRNLPEISGKAFAFSRKRGAREDLGSGHNALVEFVFEVIKKSNDPVEVTLSNIGASTSDGMISDPELSLASPLAATIPPVFVVEGNAPNPFNPTTTIRFGLPKRTQVDLEIFNIAGRRVSRPLDRREFGPGWHDFVFNADDMASGVYFYKLAAGGKSETRRMVVVK